MEHHVAFRIREQSLLVVVTLPYNATFRVDILSKSFGRKRRAKRGGEEGDVNRKKREKKK